MPQVFHLPFLTSLTLLLLLSGCGFTLRGSIALPPALQTLQVESLDPGGALTREVSRALRGNGVAVVEAGATNTGAYRLGLGQEENTEQTLSVNVNARAGEYELTLRVPFQLRRATEVVLGPEVLSVSRVYLADPENVVAKNEEAELIREEMRRDLAQQLLRRLQTLEL